MMSIPMDMRSLPNWVCWRYGERKNQRTGEVKKTKLPYQPGGGSAKANDPSTWCSFDTARAASGFDGIGFVFDGQYFGVDLDHVVGEDGSVAPEAEEIVRRMDSYTEYSPSGRGLHIFCRGTIPGGAGRRMHRPGAIEVEVYNQARYFTVTGKPYGSVRPLRDASGEARWLLDTYFSGGKAAAEIGPSGPMSDSQCLHWPSEPSARPCAVTRATEEKAQPPAPSEAPADGLDDAALLQRIQRSRQGEKFQQLWSGDASAYGGDVSSADMALCSMLAFWTGRDVARMDRLFRQSGLYREKWDERRGLETYGEMTLRKAIDSTEHALGDEEPVFQRFTEAYREERSYEVSHGRTYSLVETQNGVERKLLADFAALPVEAVLRDDGAESSQEFTVEGISSMGRALPPITVAAAKFGSMAWALEGWGLDANIQPGQSVREKLRHAIQSVGRRTAVSRTVYTHTGWRRIGGGWAYLYHGGAVGAEHVSVELEGALGAYALGDENGDVRASLRLMDVLPLRVAIPLLGQVYLAPLCEFLTQAGCTPMHTLFLAGTSGAKKTTAASLALAHFGRAFKYDHVPASFRDTANALRRKAFLTKDMPLLIDDLHPTADRREHSRMDEAAQAMARAWGDRSERGRMTASLSLHTAQPPRGVGIMTGEDLPDIGESGLARFFLVDVKPGDVRITQALGALQRDAAEGRLAAAMRGYIQWLQPQADALPELLRGDFEDLRDKVRKRLTGVHDRQPGAIASMLLGIRMMLNWGADTGVLSAQEVSALNAQALDTLVDIADAQRQVAQQESPVRLFLETLNELAVTGRVRISAVTEDAAWLPSTLDADPVGYMDSTYLYLLPTVAYGAVNREMQSTGRVLPVSQSTMWKRGMEQGYVQEHAGGTPSKTKSLLGRSVRVVWFRLDRLREMGLFTREEEPADAPAL